LKPGRLLKRTIYELEQLRLLPCQGDVTVSTLLRICAVFKTSLERLVRRLDEGIYES
jgi:hypothetical protein